MEKTEGFLDVFLQYPAGVPLDLRLMRMKVRRRVAACGALSGYSNSDHMGMKNWVEACSNKLEIKGFAVTNLFKSGGAVKALVELK